MLPVPTDLYLGFIAAACALIAMPGPNTTLIVGNTIAHGTAKGLATFGGTLSAAAIQLIVIIFGLTETMTLMATWFDRLRWLGVAYLFWLGIREWLNKSGTDQDAAPLPVRRTHTFYWQGVMISLTNPKTLAFFAAFLPQFVDPARPALPQLACLAITFVILAACGDATFCLLAGRIRPWIVGARYASLRHKISGTCLLLCGLALALVRRS
ncbi:MAG TPA: LysE family translocator [Magnetospirillaceae bacterium]|jgi:threonine/homoserine/homoserine lactone efflux protein